MISLDLINGKLQTAGCSKKQMTILEARPVIYIYYGKNAYYVGQTDQFLTRHGQHLDETGANYRQFRRVLILFGQYVDGNSQDELETLLITYLAADNALPAGGHRKPLNIKKRRNLVDYPTRKEVLTLVLPPFWETELRQEGLVQETSLKKLRQSILFKYSPFTQLSQEQSELITEILESSGSFLVEGIVGTGKTVVLTNLAASLFEKGGLQIGVVVKSNWVKAAREIFRAYGIGKNITVGTALQLIRARNQFDVILVDEAHRLRWYYPKQNHVTCDIFDREDLFKDELFLIGKLAKRLVLFYDPLQKVRPSDIPYRHFQQYIRQNAFEKRRLQAQFRVKIHDKGADYTADDYLNGILTFLQLTDQPLDFDRRVFQNQSPDAYFGVVDSIRDLFAYVDEQRQYESTAQCRVLAGYARPWGSKCKPGSKKYTEFDWAEGEEGWKWNSTHENWIARRGSEDEIGSIHAIQGVDLDYAGVIIAKDLTFADGKVMAVKENYFDANGTPVKKSFTLEELSEYVRQIYYVLLTRGISGIRIYFEDACLKRHFMEVAGLI